MELTKDDIKDEPKFCNSVILHKDYIVNRVGLNKYNNLYSNFINIAPSHYYFQTGEKVWFAPFVYKNMIINLCLL